MGVGGGLSESSSSWYFKIELIMFACVITILFSLYLPYYLYPHIYIPKIVGFPE